MLKRVYGYIKLAVILLCITMGLHSCSCNDDNHTSAPSGTISGVLQDSQDNPIAGATIEIYDGAALIATATTDSQGNYSVEVPEGSGYTLQVTAEGYETVIMDLDDVVEGETLNLELEMDPAGPTGTIAGVLIDADGGAPIAGATIEVYDGATRIGITTTDANGEYAMTIPAGDGYRVQVTADGYESSSHDDVDVTEDATTTVDFDLNASTEPTGTIQGIVRDNDGLAAISGATVEVYDGADLIATTTTDGAGAYSVEVPVGQGYRVRITAAGYDSSSDNDVDVTQGAATTVDLNLDATPEPTGTIQGVVRNAVGLAAIAGAAIEIYDGAELVSSTTTGADGDYAVEVPAGTGYMVRVSSTGFITADYNAVDIDEDETVILESILQIADTYVGNGAIAGIITDAINGAGLNGVTITLRAGLNNRTGASVTTGITAGGGAYTISDVPTGYYTAELSCAGYITAYISVYSLGGETTGNQNASISPVLAVGETRIVLTWGATPADLDSHLTGPTTSGPRFHVFWDNDSVNDGTSAALDTDDTTSYGPETITISTQIGGIYRYYVNDYTNMAAGTNPSTALSNSGAQVKVYQSTGLVATFNVPANQGGTLWAVFSLNGTTITPINTFSYDNADSGPLP